MKTLFDKAKDGMALRVHVQPGAGREAIIGTHGDALKVRVVAPPVSGRANEEVLALLAHEFAVGAETLEITSGTTARLKRVKFSGIEADEIEKRLRVLVQEATTGNRVGRR